MDKNPSDIDLNDADGEAVGSRNDERLAMFNQIADSADELRSQEFMVDDDEQEQIEQEVQEESEEPQRFKIKVNGREKELTLDELLATASKVEAADEYLANAKRQQVEPPSQDVAHTVEEDDLALARALQMGSEEEAASVIRKLRSNPSSPDDIAAKAVDRLRFEQDVNWFKEEYKDVFEDNYLRKLAIDIDEEAVRNGDTRSYRERFGAIGEDLRKWRGTSGTFKDKQERKSTIVNLPTASAKVPAPVDDEPDDSPGSVIANMARARGQMR